MTKHPRQAGFTLLELLVAISVLGLLSLGIARGLHLGAEGWARAHASTEAAGRRRDAGRLLRQIIGAAIPAFASANEDDRSVAFAGAPDTMAFVTRLPQALGTPVMVAARLFVAGQALMLAWRLDLPSAEGGGPLPETTALIASHVADVRFAYFDPQSGWQEQWSGRPSLPRLVRVQVQETGERPALWPDLLIDPRSTATTACIYDATDLQCRRVP